MIHGRKHGKLSTGIARSPISIIIVAQFQRVFCVSFIRWLDGQRRCSAERSVLVVVTIMTAHVFVTLPDHILTLTCLRMSLYRLEHDGECTARSKCTAEAVWVSSRPSVSVDWQLAIWHAVG